MRALPSETGAGVRFAVLGPPRAWCGDRELDLGPPRQRAMLALLLVHAGRPVGLDEIVDALWGGDPPPSAVNIVHRQVASLRRLFEPGLPIRAQGRWLRRSPDGYRLDTSTEDLDLLRFRDLVDRASRAGGGAPAVRLLIDALALRRGPVADGIHPTALAHPVFAAVDHEYLATLAQAADFALRAGLADQVLDTLRRAAADNPLDESVHARLALSLDATGRRSKALAVLADVRARLRDELDAGPGPELRAAHERVLNRQDPTAEDSTPHLGAGHRIPPAQLPADLPTFTGRTAELDWALALLDDPVGPAHTVVIGSGMAGVGKTTLAVHWAHRIADRFPDGQLYVDLHGFGPQDTVMTTAEAVRGFLTALGVPPRRIPVGVDAQSALFRSLLAGRRVLLVLDNAYDSDHVRPLLPGTPGCLAIVTSRRRLTGLLVAEGAASLRLDLLTAAEAHDLLARRIGLDRVAAEPDAVRHILAVCAGLPLALAVVAARAQASPAFPLAALAAELDDAHGGFDAFAEADPKTDVRAVFSWSYRAVGDAAARLFRLLALHPGPHVSAASAASLAGLPPHAARAALAELGYSHLVIQHAPGRHTSHDLLRAYAAELVHVEETEDQRNDAILRLLDHYLHTASEADHRLSPHRTTAPTHSTRPGVTPEDISSRAQAMAWFTDERPVLLAVIDMAARSGFDRHAVGIAAAVGDFLDRQGHWHDWVNTQHTALAATRRLDDRTAQARIHRFLGVAYSHLGRLDEAHTHLRQSLDLHTRLDDPAGRATVHRGLAALYQARHQPELSLPHGLRAVALYRMTDDQVGLGNALNESGWDHALLGDYPPALESCTQALTLQQRIGDRRGEAATWDSLGYIHHHIDDIPRAIACYQRSARLRHHLGERYPEARTLHRLGDVHSDNGDATSARDAWRRALAILTALDHPDADQVRTRLARRPDQAPRHPGMGRLLR